MRRIVLPLLVVLPLSLGALYISLLGSSLETTPVLVRTCTPSRDAGAASCIRDSASDATAAQLPTTGARPSDTPAATPTAGTALASAPTPVRVSILASIETLSPAATPTASPAPTLVPTWPLTAAFSPRADTYVSLDVPGISYASSSQLLAIGGGAEKRSFLSFTVAGLPANARVTSAKLRLTVINDSSGGGEVYSLSNTSWPEMITWRSQPAIDGPRLAALGPVALNTVVEIDVGTVVKGNGDYSFAIIAPPDNRNAVGYASDQNFVEASRPRLVLVAQKAGAGQPEPTPTIVIPPWFVDPHSKDVQPARKHR